MDPLIQNNSSSGKTTLERELRYYLCNLKQACLEKKKASKDQKRVSRSRKFEAVPREQVLLAE